VPGSASSFSLDPDELVVLADELTEPEFEDLLARPAAQVAPAPALEEPIPEPTGEESIREDAFDALFLTVLLIEEGVVAYVKAKYDEKQHPRWPAHTPGGKGGQYMQIGERFTKDGKLYEISAIHHGKVVAQLATGKGTGEVVLPKAQAEKVSPAAPHVIAGGKGSTAANHVTISPFVEPSTHDKSIPKPATWKGSDEEWARFGKLDQEHLVHLEERFGPWSHGKSKSLVSELQKQYDSMLQQVVSSALSSQYGSSSGNTLNLSGVTNAGTAASQAKYEKAKLLLRDVAEAIQWDLYHRTKGPDVAMFHWGHSSASSQKAKHADQGTPIMSAYSMSTGAFQTTGFGSTLTAVPMAIRHVEMHTHSGGVYTSFEGEYEVTTGARMKVDDRAFFSSSAMPSDVKKYLQKLAPNGGEPASGRVLYEANKALKNPGYELPIPPEPPGVQPLAVGGSAPQYKQLPADVAAQAMKVGLAAPYSGGSKETAAGVLEHLGVKAGDFLEGMKGTRYVVIDDPGDHLSHLRYVKLDPSTGQPNYAKSYPFNASGGNTFHRLDAHVDLPKPKPEPGFAKFGPEQYAKLDKGPVQKVAAFGPGDMLMIDGEGFKVIPDAAPGAKIAVVSLDTGKKFSVNSGFKTAKLVPKGSFVPPEPGAPESPFEAATEADLPAQPSWLAGKKALFGAGKIEVLITAVEGSAAEITLPTGVKAKAVLSDLVPLPVKPVGVSPNKAEPGDKFAWDGKGPYVVSSVLKDGTIRAKVSGGKVEKFSPVDLKVQGSMLYRPSTWAIGDPVKAGELEYGDVVQGGAGDKIRPYMMLGAFGTKMHLRNLETGQVVQTTKAKTFKRLLDADQIKAAEKPGPAEAPAPAHQMVPKMAKTGEVKPANEFEVGEGYVSTLGKQPFMWVTVAKNPDGSKTVQKADMDGKVLSTLDIDADMANMATVPQEVWAPASPAQQAVKPELAGKFQAEKYVHGAQAKLADLPEGSLFLSSTGIPMQLKSKAPKGGATAVALHNGKTVKNLSYEKPMTTLVEKTEVAVEPDAYKVGDLMPAEALQMGDHFLTKIGTLAKVTEVLEGDQYGVALQEPNGMVWYLHPGETYQKAAPLSAGTAPTTIPADGLPQAPDYVTYLHPKSGSKKYPLVTDMAPGSVFLDKSGKAWKVKQSGGQAVITDGSKLFSVDPAWRGNMQGVSAQAAFIDNAELPDAEPKGEVTVGHLKEGDKFEVPAGYAGAGNWYEVVDTTPTPKEGGAWHTIHVKALGKNPDSKNGIHTTISTSLKPSSILHKDSGVGEVDGAPTPAPMPLKPKVPKLQDPAGQFTATGEPVEHDEVPDYEFAANKSGRIAYMAVKPSGESSGLFWLGTNTKVPASMPLTKVHLAVRPPSDEHFEPSGKKVPAQEVPVGATIKVGAYGTLATNLGKGNAGWHGLTNDGEVLIAPKGSSMVEVELMQPKGSSAAEVQPPWVEGDAVQITGGVWAGKTANVTEVEPNNGTQPDHVAVKTSDGMEGLVPKNAIKPIPKHEVGQAPFEPTFEGTAVKDAPVGAHVVVWGPIAGEWGSQKFEHLGNGTFKVAGSTLSNGADWKPKGLKIKVVATPEPSESNEPDFEGTAVADVPVGAHVKVWQSTDVWGSDVFEHLGGGTYKMLHGVYPSNGYDWTDKNLKLKLVGGTPESPAADELSPGASVKVMGGVFGGKTGHIEGEPTAAGYFKVKFDDDGYVGKVKADFITVTDGPAASAPSSTPPPDTTYGALAVGDRFQVSNGTILEKVDEQQAKVIKPGSGSPQQPGQLAGGFMGYDAVTSINSSSGSSAGAMVPGTKLKPGMKVLNPKAFASTQSDLELTVVKPPSGTKHGTAKKPNGENFFLWPDTSYELVREAPSAPAVWMPKTGDTMPAGVVTDVNPNHPNGPVVEIGGDNTWMTLKDAMDSPDGSSLAPGTTLTLSNPDDGGGADDEWTVDAIHPDGSVTVSWDASTGGSGSHTYGPGEAQKYMASSIWTEVSKPKSMQKFEDGQDVSVLDSNGVPFEAKIVSFDKGTGGYVVKDHTGDTFEADEQDIAPSSSDDDFEPDEEEQLAADAPGTEAVAAGDLSVGDTFVSEPGDDPATLGWKVTGFTENHVDATQAEPFDPAKQVSPSSLGVPKGSTVYKVASASDGDFFDKLANGDKAIYKGPGGGPSLVTVTDNQAPGLGVEVTDEDGVSFPAWKAHLSPAPEDPPEMSGPPATYDVTWEVGEKIPQGVPMSELPAGLVYQAPGGPKWQILGGGKMRNVTTGAEVTPHKGAKMGAGSTVLEVNAPSPASPNITPDWSVPEWTKNTAGVTMDDLPVGAKYMPWADQPDNFGIILAKNGHMVTIAHNAFLDRIRASSTRATSSIRRRSRCRSRGRRRRPTRRWCRTCIRSPGSTSTRRSRRCRRTPSSRTRAARPTAWSGTARRPRCSRTWRRASSSWRTRRFG
jgi:hypothetical protein